MLFLTTAQRKAIPSFISYPYDSPYICYLHRSPCWLFCPFSVQIQKEGERQRGRADSCGDNRALVATVRGFDWRLGGVIDKDPPAAPVTAPVREPARLTSDVSTGTARSHPQHTHIQRQQPKHLAYQPLTKPFTSASVCLTVILKGMTPILELLYVFSI